MEQARDLLPRCGALPRVKDLRLRARPWAAAWLTSALLWPQLAPADPETPAPPAPESWALHGQATYVEQETTPFHSPYVGANSLTPDRGAETTDATLYLGLRPWASAELWLTPEVDQGFGLDNTLGMAGFPSAEAYKVGHNQPYLRLPRAFVRETLDLGGESQVVEPDQMQLGGLRTADRWVFTVGKFGVPDVFDTNQYAHDARNDFLNWTAIEAGTFDYAADSWGFSIGGAAEWYTGAWTLRGGVFDLSNIPNSEHLDPGFHEFQLVGEVEHRHEIFGSSGRLLLTVYDSRGRMGLYRDALALAAATDTLPSTAAVRQYRSRLGASLDLEQTISEDLGVFARFGKAAGNVETYEFTDADRSVSAGVSLKGTAWRRGSDRIALAGIVNGISGEFERYLNAGGLGPLIGDGQLPHPGAEQILETYYNVEVRPWAHLTLDYQWARNPAYNSDRGPVSIVAVRLHLQF
jgi:high affinity Mn2+ porin